MFFEALGEDLSPDICSLVVKRHEYFYSLCAELYWECTEDFQSVFDLLSSINFFQIDEASPFPNSIFKERILQQKLQHFQLRKTNHINYLYDINAKWWERQMHNKNSEMNNNTFLSLQRERMVIKADVKEMIHNCKLLHSSFKKIRPLFLEKKIELFVSGTFGENTTRREMRGFIESLKTDTEAIKKCDMIFDVMMKLIRACESDSNLREFLDYDYI